MHGVREDGEAMIRPRRIVRTLEDCQVVLTRRWPDMIGPDGEIIPGDTMQLRQSPGTGWWWLGRMWFWRPW